jgi:hypothetical protein
MGPPSSLSAFLPRNAGRRRARARADGAGVECSLSDDSRPSLFLTQGLREVCDWAHGYVCHLRLGENGEAPAHSYFGQTKCRSKRNTPSRADRRPKPSQEEEMEKPSLREITEQCDNQSE